ncbi:MAG TPA: ABC transporter ATP-binding protein [Gemmatimonadales bacterium]|nr:ABC transporter ATP-binding protein [Gemmatimonadales bacterium]
MTYLSLHTLTRRYTGSAGVFDLSLTLERGKILALLGPSGSGKTTTLRLLGGFEAPDGGRILVEGEEVTPLRPEHRRFGMVFQHYALFPHLDVGQNVAFGLESRGVAPAEAAARVREALALVDLAGFERRTVGALSGGQQQRVALARALAPAPRVLLLDEPLSNLDPALRERTRRELRALIHRVGITTVIVTHEQEDAFDLGDVVAVLRDGRLQQAGPPEALYRTPANPFVGGFIGRSSWLEATVVAVDAGGTRIRVEKAEWRLGAGGPGAVGSRVRVMLRPEALEIGPPGGDGLQGRVTDRRFTGATAHFTVETEGGAVLEVSAPPDIAVVDQRVTLVPRHDPADREYVLHCFATEAR